MYGLYLFNEYLCNMIQIQNKIISALTAHAVSVIRFIDVTKLPVEQNRGLPHAILLGLTLSPSYLRKVMETTDYVPTIIAQNQIENDEFYLTEHKAGALSDYVAEILVSEGYQAYSQSDEHLIKTSAWDEINQKTLFPHKTIAVMSGVGWIGKNNLLVTPEFGSALCIGTILTDAPLNSIPLQITESKCGACKNCVSVCQTNALTGVNWEQNISREDIVDIHKCTTCMKCMIYCSYTQRFLKQH